MTKYLVYNVSVMPYDVFCICSSKSDAQEMVKKANTPYENYVSQDIYKNSNQKIENGLPTGYNRSWADEF